MGYNIIEVEGDDIILENTRYPGTPGLYELIFNKKPKSFNDADKKLYGDIVNKTNIAFRNFDSTKKMRENESYKFKKIIKPLVDSHNQSSPPLTRSQSKIVGGLGFDANMKYELNRPIQYRYWDNLEELVDRLCLLHAARNAGNNNVGNEILAIEEELREASIII